MCCACRCIKNGWDLSYAFLKKQWREDYFSNVCRTPLKQAPPLSCCEKSPALLHRMCSTHEGQILSGMKKQCCWCSKYGEFCDPYELMANQTWTSCRGRMFQTPRRPECNGDKLHVVCSLHQKHRMCCMCAKDDNYNLKMVNKQGPYNWADPYKKVKCGQPKYISHDMIRRECCSGPLHRICDKHWNNTICCECVANINESKSGVCCDEHRVTRPERRLQVFRHPFYSQTRRIDVDDEPDTKEEEMLSRKSWGECFDAPCLWTEKHLTMPMYYCHHPKGSRRLHYYCDMHYDQRPRRQACCACWDDRSNVKREAAISEWYQVNLRLVQKQGQVTSHHTGNSPNITSAEASGGSSITTINYYGAAYAQAYNPSQQQMDPSQFTEPIADIAGAATQVPMLQSPSAEECGYSDRIMQLTAGNSTLITQEAAAGAVIGYGVYPGTPDNSGAAIDLPSRPGPSCDRWYTLDSLGWTASGIRDYNTGESRRWAMIPLPGILINTGVFGQMCQYHYLWRGGFAIHIQCNATKFHSGFMGVYLVPEAEISGTTADNFYDIRLQDTGPNGMWRQQMPIYPHQFINLRTNNSATVLVPYVNFVPQSCPLIHSPWSIVLVSHQPLAYSSGATTEVPITISVCPLDSNFGGLRSAISTQGVPVFAIPGSGQFSTTLRNSGMPVFPDYEKPHSFDLPGRCVNLLQLARVATFATFDSNYDAIQVANDTKTPGTNIFSIDLSLMSASLDTTYLSKLTRFFSQYRGTIKFTFVFAGTAMTTGKILIAYTPPGGSAPTTREQAMLSTHVVWDLGLQSSLSFTVPYISTSQMRYASIDGGTMSYCGYLTGFMQTMLVHPTGVPTTSPIFVMVSAGDDFVLRLPIDSAYYQGLGETITNHVQTLVGNALESSMQIPAGNAPPIVSGNEASHTQSMSIENGGSSALTAVETGVTQSDPGTSTLALRNTPAKFSAMDTDLEHFFSRYTFVADVTLTDQFANLPLSFSRMVQTTGMTRTKFNMFTYYRFDLDIVIVPRSKVAGRYSVLFCPPGSLTPTASSSTAWKSSNNTQVFGANDETPTTMRIPFCSPANYYTTQYNGFNGFDLQDYAQPPHDLLGNLCFRSLNNEQFVFSVYARPINIEAYCPRPILTYKTTTNASASVNRIVPVEDGPRIINLQDVPEVRMQGPVTFQGLNDWLSGLVRSGGKNFSEGLTEGVSSALFDYVSSNPGMSPTVFDWVKTVLKWLTRIVSSLVILVKSNGDPAIVSALAISLGVDLVTIDPFDWLKTKVLNFFGWKKKQGMSEWLKELNVAINAMKGLDWIATKIKAFLDWFKGVEDEVRKDMEKADEVFKVLPSLMTEWDQYEKDKSKFTESSVVKLAEKILECKKILLETGKTDNRLYTILLRYTQKATKFCADNKKRPFEPIGLLVHGRPGCGKSLLTNVLARQLCKMMGVGEPYSIPPDPDHFDGYTGQDVVIMDDLGQNPDGKDCAMLCQMISCAEFIPPMADLEDKGIPFTSKFILASTNLDTLRPVTVSDPAAISRRFEIDLEMTVCDEYKTPLGHLDVAKAMTPCEGHESMHFKFCTPFICGKACKIYNRRDKKFTTPDLLIARLTGERRRKVNTSGLVDALFQGKNGCVVEYTPTLQIIGVEDEVPTKIMPNELADLIRSVDDSKIIEWCEKKGYIIEPDLDKIIIERESRKLRTWVKSIIAGIGVVSLVGGLIYAAWRLWPTDAQGAYTSNGKSTLKRPELRPVQVQGPTPSPDMQYIQAIMGSNLIPIQTATGPYTAFGIYERWLVLPKHAAVGPYFIGGKEVVCDDSVELQSNGFNLELACLHFPTINEVKDLRKHLPDNLHGEDNCYLALNSSAFPRMVVPVGRVSVFGVVNLEMSITKNTMTYAYPTKMGQCGGLICKAGKIIGIHIGGDGSNGYAAALRKSYFVKLEGKRSPERPARASVNVRSSTSLQPSMWHDILPGDKEPAVLSKHDRRCKVNFEEALFDKYQGNEKISSKDQMLISLAAKHYVEQIRPLMPPDLTTPLSLEEAVYGAPGLEALDLNTSAGFPYCTRGISKKSLIPPRGEPLTRLQDALDLHGYKLPFVTFLKDELRPKEKVEQGKTRLIEASSLNDTLFMKQHLGRLFQVFNTNPGTVLGSAVGCNPDIHWSKFVVELGHENICAFDYKNFDASLHPCWFVGLKEVLCGLGFDEDLINGIVNHICFSTHIYRNVEYDVEGGMPSGTSGTSIFNSIINNLIVRTLVLDTYKGIDLDQLKILAYGDDLLVSYPFPLDPGALAETGKKFGLKMTPADKSETFDGVKNIWEVTFLKRRFVPDTQFPFLIHPVYPMDQIYESLRWTRKPSETNQHVRSLCELAWHNGREDYEKFTQVVRSVPIGRAFTIPAFDVLLQKWYDQF